MSRHFVLREAFAFSILSLIAVFCLVALVPSNALAQGKKKSVAVGVIEGPQGDATRRRVLTKLKDSGQYVVTDAEDLRPGSDKGAYAAMAKALQIDAIIVGRVARGYNLTLTLIGPDGNRIEDVKLQGGSARGLQKAVDTKLLPAIAGQLGAKAAPESEEEPEEEEEEGEEAPEDEELDAEEGAGDEEEEDAPSEEDEEAEGGGPSEPMNPGLRPLELLVGLRLYNRNFAYRDLSLGAVLPYELALAPSIIAAARLYPFAFFRDDALSHIGIQAKLEVGIATSTNYQQPQPGGAPPIVHPLNTGTSEWHVGLRGRMPLDGHELGVFGLYGSHSFVLVGDEGPTVDRPNRPYPLVPDVDYRFLRFGLDARLRFGIITLGAHFAPRFLTSMRQIDQPGFWFPGATGSGVDFGVSGSLALLKFLDVAAGVDYLRYGFDFNGIPDDAGCRGPGDPAPTCTAPSTAPLIAGGATDTYLSGWAGVILHFGGRGVAADGSVSVEADTDSEDAESEDSEPEDVEPEDAEPEDAEDEEE